MLHVAMNSEPTIEMQRIRVKKLIKRANMKFAIKINGDIEIEFRLCVRMNHSRLVLVGAFD
jgi:hypothetical protein